MTNYNKRLDEVVRGVVAPAWLQQAHDTTDVPAYNLHIHEAKQAITSLIKELVAEAKPGKKDQMAQSTLEDESRCRFYRYGGYNFAIDEFEQNLLKELEEV